MKPLKLLAMDSEDLEIISAHLQDALGRVGDFAWLPQEKRFVCLLNRFAWDVAFGAEDEHAELHFERRRAALHFERVEAVRMRKICQDKPDGVLNLLAVRFTPGEPPGGAIDLLFSSDAAIRLEVECVEARMCDLGPSWQTDARPDHPVEAEDPVQGG